MNPYIRLLSTGSFGRPCRNKLSPVQEAKAPTGGAVQQAAVVARALPRSHWYRAMRSKPGPPATLGSTANAHLELIVLCRDCRHKAEPDPAEMAAIRCRLAGPGVGQAARLQQVRQPQCQLYRERNQARSASLVLGQRSAWGGQPTFTPDFCARSMIVPTKVGSSLRKPSNFAA